MIAWPSIRRRWILYGNCWGLEILELSDHHDRNVTATIWPFLWLFLPFHTATVQYILQHHSLGRLQATTAMRGVTKILNHALWAIILPLWDCPAFWSWRFSCGSSRLMWPFASRGLWKWLRLLFENLRHHICRMSALLSGFFFSDSTRIPCQMLKIPIKDLMDSYLYSYSSCCCSFGFYHFWRLFREITYPKREGTKHHLRSS